MNKSFKFGLTGSLGTLVAGGANAATDVSAITAAGADGLAYAGAIAGVMIAIWGAKLAYRKFFGG